MFINSVMFMYVHVCSCMFMYVHVCSCMFTSDLSRLRNVCLPFCVFFNFSLYIFLITHFSFSSLLPSLLPSLLSLSPSLSQGPYTTFRTQPWRPRSCRYLRHDSLSPDTHTCSWSSRSGRSLSMTTPSFSPARRAWLVARCASAMHTPPGHGGWWAWSPYTTSRQR